MSAVRLEFQTSGASSRSSVRITLGPSGKLAYNVLAHLPGTPTKGSTGTKPAEVHDEIIDRSKSARLPTREPSREMEVARAAGRESPVSESVLDIRTYRTVPGARDELVRLMAEETVPMLRRHGIEVVTLGPSIRDEDHSFLIRFFESLEEREEQLARFYGSEEWLTNYDERVMTLIETYHVVVVSASRGVAMALASIGIPPIE
jgi:NIPSNAP